MTTRIHNRFLFALLPLVATSVVGCGGNQATSQVTSQAPNAVAQAPASSPSDSAGAAASTAPKAPEGAAAKGAGGKVMSSSGYKITVPEGWSDGAASAPKMVDLVVTAPAEENFAANLNVVVVPAGPGETLEAAKKQLPAAYPKMFTKYVQLKQGDLSVDGTPGMFNTANHTTGTPPRKLWMHQAFFLRGGKVYTVTCTALESNRQKYEADFNSMIQSLKWS